MAVKKIGVTEQTYYRWKKKFGGLRIDQAKRLKELEKENTRLKRLLADAELDSGVSRGRIGKLLSPAKRRRAVEHVRDALGRDRLSERRACLLLGQHRNTQRRQRHVPDDEPRLVTRIVWLACEYGRYGYRRITALLHWEGWRVNHKRVERIWREEGLKVPKKQPKRRRLWLNDGSCIRLRPAHRNHVWSYDFVADRTSDGRLIRMLTIVDEFTRECLAIDVAKRLTSEDVLERLSDLFVHQGVPEHIRSDNGSEFTAKCVREWLGRVGVKTLFIEPGSPWENGYVESFFRVASGRAAGTGSVRHAARGQGTHRAVAAALQHCPTAQCPWVSPPGSRGAAALCGRLGYASATAQGWSVGGQKPNLETGGIHGGRSSRG